MIVKQFSLRRCFSVALSYHQAGDQVISRMRIILFKNLKFEWFLKVTLIVSVRTCSEGDRFCLFEWVFFITSLCQKIYAVQIVHGIKINSYQPSKISFCIFTLPRVSSVVTPIALLFFAKSWDVTYPMYTIPNTECIQLSLSKYHFNRNTNCKCKMKALHHSIGPKNWGNQLDRSQPLFYFVPQEKVILTVKLAQIATSDETFF